MSSLQVIQNHRIALDSAFPGLVTAIEEAANHQHTQETFILQVLISLKNTVSFANGLKSLSPERRKQLLDFIGGKKASEVVGERSNWPPPPPPGNGTPDVHLSSLSDGNGQPIKVVTQSFTNWSGTVTNNPQETLVPTTVVGVQNIIKQAASNNQRIRVAGFRQTWSNLYSSDSQVLISLIPLETATGSSADVESSVYGPETDFNKIELMPAGTDDNKRLARIGAGVTNEAFRIWAIKNGWTLPANVIVVENTIAGVNAPICHGAGIAHGPPNDRVREIEYVDANGNVQSVSDPVKLKAAAAAFGLLGVVTHLTFELDKMTYTMGHPIKQHAMLAVPPPAGWDIPAALKGDFSPEQLQTALAEFIQKAKDSYYCEWFWFAFQPEVWVNCWNNDTDPVSVIDCPDQTATFRMWMQNSADCWLNAEAEFRALPGRVQGAVNGLINFNRSPPIANNDGVYKSYLPNGIHYRRGTQNFPILDTEFEIPIPAMASDPTKPDWSYVQRAWWDAITIAENDPTGAVRVGIEMRIIGPSDMILAPQQGSTFGFASIEIVTSLSSGVDNTWIPLVQKIIDKWTSYQAGGVKLNPKPHWAKIWEGYTVDGVDMKTHLKTVAYKDQIPSFMSTLGSIGKEQGWTIEDIKGRFSNPLLDSVLF